MLNVLWNQIDKRNTKVLFRKDNVTQNKPNCFQLTQIFLRVAVETTATIDSSPKKEIVRAEQHSMLSAYHNFLQARHPADTNVRYKQQHAKIQNRRNAITMNIICLTCMFSGGRP